MLTLGYIAKTKAIDVIPSITLDAEKHFVILLLLTFFAVLATRALPFIS
jgi:hypothetical protein